METSQARVLADERRPTVLLAHGSMMRSSMFQPQIEALGASYRMIAYDNITWSFPDRGFTLDDLVEDCRSQMDRHGLERCILLGMSMGGHMALEFAVKYPERLEALILTGAGALAFPPEIKELTGDSFKALDIDGLVPRSWAEFTATVVFGASTYTNNPSLIEYWIDRWTREPARSVYHQGMTWINKRDILAPLAETDLPILVVQGAEEGAYLNEWILPMLEMIPTIQSVTIPQAGHFVSIEQPARFNRAVCRFLDTL